MPTDLQKARELFLHAVGKLPTEQWDGYVAEACGKDSDLAQQVRCLLQVHCEAGSFLDAPAPGLEKTVTRTALYPDLSEGPGTVIGQYKLLQQIGEGGMGVVFMAEQSEPIQRTVALKIIKPGMDTRQVIARFEAERQAVAMMDHPNIAKVLDAGTTDSGRPYFVMELVKGVPITKYCDEKHLPLRERLELFIQVCQAVQHAHQKGIIHRDIKPNNVLVAEYDHHAIPKVIDFGVAKATAQKLTELTMFTEFGQVLGTMEFMSPEQAKLNQLDIDTRSDIYSLGVLLYELLSGSTPFEGKRLHEAAFDEMLRIIREEEPPKPSTRLSTTDQLPSIAANRGSEPAKLGGLLKGELDWIAMKALEKDRNRRYQTASAFADDLHNYLTDQPVAACPPSSAYRLKKFVRRNKSSVVAASAVSAAVIAGLVVASIGFYQARREARNVRIVGARADRTLAAIVNSEGKGKSKPAEDLARKAVATTKELLGENDPETLDSIHILALVLSKTKPDEAIVLERESIARRRKLLNGKPANHDLAWSLDNLAILLKRKGEVAEAESLFREALPVWRQAVGNDHQYVANTLDHMAALLSKQGKQAEAETCIRECLAIRTRLLGEKHPSTITTLNSLNELLEQKAEGAKAEKKRSESANGHVAEGSNGLIDQPTPSDRRRPKPE
jgi:eukaryotic-like serine/threonine-protein kinase